MPHRPTERDSLLRSDVIATLRTTGYQPLDAIVVLDLDGVIVLQGTVPTYHLKQMAQVAAQQVTGVQGLRNELQVSSKGRPLS